MQIKEELGRSLQETPGHVNTIELGAQIADSGLLLISPRQYREYADEWKGLARDANNDQQRALCLKMANIWLYAAVQFEAGLEANSALGPIEGESD